MSKTPTKRTSDADQSMHITPPKTVKLYDAQLTPSPSRLQMNTLDAALNHYFSPKKKSPSRSPGRFAQRKVDFQMNETSEESESSIIENVQPTTSANKQPKFHKTLEIIVTKDPDLGDIQQCLLELDTHLPKKITEHNNTIVYLKIYSQWLKLLKTGEFNILVHGLGSKRKLFDIFLKQLLAYNIFVIDGLDQDTTVLKLLNNVQMKLGLDHIRRGIISLTERAKCLVKGINKLFAKHRNKELIIFIVHNIDSLQFRTKLQQEALAILAQSKYVRLMASVDHVNAALLWDQAMRDSFKWLYFSISTLCCYNQELGNGKFLGFNVERNNRTHTVESLDVFWEATTSNMRKILEQLTIHAPLQSERNKRDVLKINKFCQILKEEFATTSETALRQQLIEFCDHNIISLDQDDNILLTVDRQLLSAFLDKKITAIE